MQVCTILRSQPPGQALPSIQSDLKIAHYSQNFIECRHIAIEHLPLHAFVIGPPGWPVGLRGDQPQPAKIQRRIIDPRVAKVDLTVRNNAMEQIEIPSRLITNTSPDQAVTGPTEDRFSGNRTAPGLVAV